MAQPQTLNSTQGTDQDQNPPIATDGVSGLTTQWAYINNLMTTTGVNMQLMTSSGGTATVSVQNVYLAVQNFLGVLSNSGTSTLAAACSAVVTMNPAGEASVAVADAMGRTIATATLTTPMADYATPTSLRLVRYDGIGYLTAFSNSTGGSTVETEQLEFYNINSSNIRSSSYNTTRSYADGGGRVLQTTDALGNITTMQYDWKGNQLSLRDRNSTGWNAGTAVGTTASTA